MPHSPERVIPRLIGRAVVFPIVAMALLAAVLVAQGRALLSLTSWVDHTDKVIAVAQGLGRRLAEGEAALRGFAVTQQPAFLEPLAEAQREASAALEELGRLVADNPEQERRLARIADESRQWNGFALATVERLQRTGTAPQIPAVIGRARMESLRQVLDDFVREEQRLLDQRTQRSTAVARRVMFGSVALVLLLGGLLGFTAQRQMRGLVGSFRSALTSARATIELREEFLTIAAHELRTPLTALQLQLQRLQREAARHGTDPSMPEMALRQTRRLAALIESLIDAHALSSGSDLPLHKEELDLAELARQVATRLTKDLEHLRCTMDIAAPRPVVGRWDRARMGQLVAALVSNACKYGEGKPVHVEVSLDGAMARLSVRDEGIGIAADQQERIFGRFGRAVSARAYGGFGLGLYAARRIAELHGGEIQVKSAVGEGATFTLVVPSGIPQIVAA